MRRRKKHYVLIKDFNRFTYDHSLQPERKHFCRYSLHPFFTLRHIKVNEPRYKRCGVTPHFPKTKK